MNKVADLNISDLDASIIQYLVSTNDYCTSFDIASAISINRRQVRGEMNSVKNILAKLGYTLDSKRSKGYLILERSELDNLVNIICSTGTEYGDINTPEGRQSFLCQVLYIDDEYYIKLDDLADMMFVSRSTVNNSLTQLAKNIFNKYNLTIEYRSRNGLKLVGTELGKREMYCDIVFDLLGQSHKINTFVDLFRIPDAHLENEICKVIQRYHIHLSDIAFADFMLYLTTTGQRISTGKVLTSSPDMTPIKGRPEFDPARVIGSLISNYFNVSVNEHEINRIAIKIIAKQSSSQIKLNVNNPLTQKIMDESFNEIYQQTHISFTSPVYYPIFERYIYATTLILQYHEKIRNPLYHQVSDHYPLAYLISNIVADVMEKYTGFRMSSSHIAFYTIFFNNWIQNLKSHHENVLLIGGYGSMAAESVRYEINQRLGNMLAVKDTCMYHELDDYNLSEYAFVITTLPIAIHLTIPVITISQHVLDDDINKIRRFISSDYKNFHPCLSFCPSLFKSGVIIKNLHDASKSLSNLICSILTRLKAPYVERCLLAEQNRIETLNNGILMIKIDKALSSHSIVAQIILSKKILYDEEDIWTIIVISSEDKTLDLFSAVYETCSKVPYEAIEKLAKNNGTYIDFLSLLD
jgi:Transcriptional antiterminator